MVEATAPMIDVSGLVNRFVVLMANADGLVARAAILEISVGGLITKVVVLATNANSSMARDTFLATSVGGSMTKVAILVTDTCSPMVKDTISATGACNLVIENTSPNAIIKATVLVTSVG